MSVNINAREYLERRIRDKDAVEFLLKHFTEEEAVKLLRHSDVEVVRDKYMELWETHCYEHVSVLVGKAEVIDEEKGVCQDGPDIWTVYSELLRIHAPAIVKHYKTPDRVYGGWRKIIILLPPGGDDEKYAKA